MDPGFLERGNMFKGVGVRFADFISFYLNIPWKWNSLVSLRPNYFIFIWYLKMEGGERGSSDPLCVHHWDGFFSTLVSIQSLNPLLEIESHNWTRAVIENYFSFFLNKNILLWVLKRTISMRWFFWAPKKQALIKGKENNCNFSMLKKFPHLDLCGLSVI